MSTRADGAARTRRALLDAAAALLEEGGPAAVTLRAVGDRAGVSRGAPYGHFEGKAHLLAALAEERWRELRGRLDALAASGLDARRRLRDAVGAFVELGIEHRPTYELMFTVPDEHPELVARAASEAQDVFIGLVADVVGPADPRRTAALIMAGAHGIAGMAANGHLRVAKWGVDAPGLVDDLLRAATGRSGS